MEVRFARGTEVYDAVYETVRKVLTTREMIQNVPFGKEEMDPIEWVCCLSAINKETHLKAMFQLVNLFYNQSFREKIKECKTGEEIYKIIEQFEYEMR